MSLKKTKCLGLVVCGIFMVEPIHMTWGGLQLHFFFLNYRFTVVTLVLDHIRLPNVDATEHNEKLIINQWGKVANEGVVTLC